jgi:hypothetical protein
VIAVVSPISVPLEETAHTCDEKEGCRRGGAP